MKNHINKIATAMVVVCFLSTAVNAELPRAQRGVPGVPDAGSYNGWSPSPQLIRTTKDELKAVARVLQRFEQQESAVKKLSLAASNVNSNFAKAYGDAKEFDGRVGVLSHKVLVNLGHQQNLSAVESAVFPIAVAYHVLKDKNPQSSVVKPSLQSVVNKHMFSTGKRLLIGTALVLGAVGTGLAIWKRHAIWTWLKGLFGKKEGDGAAA